MNRLALTTLLVLASPLRRLGHRIPAAPVTLLSLATSVATFPARRRASGVGTFRSSLCRDPGS